MKGPRNHASTSPAIKIEEKDDSIFDWLPEKSVQVKNYKHNPIQLSNDLIKDKYFEAFNFYFSKPINEILANLSIPHVILYKDYLYYDDTNEYLKRYYKHDESQPRINNLSEFYHKATYGMSRPNLAIHEQNKIVLKRNAKLHKMYLNKLKQFDDIPQTQRDHPGINAEMKILNNMHDESESSWDPEQEDAPAPKPNDGNYEKILNDDGEVHQSFQNLLEKYENLMGNISYDSELHDVYNPSYSSQGGGDQDDTLNFQSSIKHDGQTSDHLRNPMPDERSISITGSIENIGRDHHGKQRIGGEDIQEFSDFGFSDADEINLIHEMMTTTEEKKIKDLQEKALSKPKAAAPENSSTQSKIKPQTADVKRHSNQSSKSKAQSNGGIAAPASGKTKGTTTAATTETLNSLQNSAKKKPSTGVIHIQQKSGTFKKTEHIVFSDRKPSHHQEDSDIPYDRHLSRDKNSQPQTQNTTETRFTNSSPKVHYIKSNRESQDFQQSGKFKAYTGSSPRVDIPELQLKERALTQEFDPALSGGLYDPQKRTMSNASKKSESERKRMPSHGGSGTQQKPNLHPNTVRYVAGVPVKNSEEIMTERDPNKPKNSIQYIKELVQKYHKYSDEFLNSKSKMLFDEFKKSTMYAKLTGYPEKSNEKQQKIKEIYSHPAHEKAKKGENHHHHHQNGNKANYLARSKTEDALLKNFNQGSTITSSSGLQGATTVSGINSTNQSGLKGNKKLHMSPSKADLHAQPVIKTVQSPIGHHTRKEKPVYRFISNEGLSSWNNGSQSQAQLTHMSTENSKSHTHTNGVITEYPYDEHNNGGGGNHHFVQQHHTINLKQMKNDKTLSDGSKKSSSTIQKVQATMTAGAGDIKPPLKPTQNHHISNNQSKSTKRGTQTGSSLSSSAQKGSTPNLHSVQSGSATSSMPVSPNRKFDFKLNLNRLNQGAPKQSEENVNHANTAAENSYGFWTSRSAKLIDEKARAEYSKTPGDMRYGHDSSGQKYHQDSKDYYVRANAKGNDDKKRVRNIKNSGPLTKSQPNLDFKFKENDVASTMKTFNQPAFKTTLSSAENRKTGNHSYGGSKSGASTQRYSKKSK